MLIALTGTPGTGKTTVSALLPYPVVDVNALVKGGLCIRSDPDRGCLEADMEGLADKVREMDGPGPVVLEGHISHHLADLAVVLRLHPSQLRSRLSARGYPPAKVNENILAEALDVILVEAVERCDRVWEIDTTGLSPSQVAGRIQDAVEGREQFPPRGMNWLGEIEIDLG
ncbi:MAG: putative kinase [Methanosaeta sp. PtaB.Bin039]|mgnify:CR=1 FL=1|nr:MAG: putative kinase [Methanosaeta sp. PtaB.Bin039]HOT07515.1 adenylate kinase family protein [Methanotrichaceae archaeon]HQF16113.1 adenylate kinase family protein [Methanotrichaceae archaeon]HQI90773.1 adenylate kinase family protein [Methanotrichaceae archaeon]HQJ28271.1 adenylate kinase family protein [Methanotrichaceae archaeon]